MFKGSNCSGLDERVACDLSNNSVRRGVDEQHAYHKDMSELQQLTGQCIEFIGSRARENLKRALVMARNKSQIGTAPPDCILRHLAREWVEISWQDREHETCENVRVQCIGCRKQVCAHLSEYVCSFLPVCKWCDTHVQPNPFNPVNRLTLLPVCNLTVRLCNEIDKNQRFVYR